nr:MAG TPA: hypothetical protein [Caudoviricetes sp.]
MKLRFSVFYCTFFKSACIKTTKRLDLSYQNSKSTITLM